jgi:hypothetical protein
LHAHPVTEDRAAREGARGIDREDADARAVATQTADEPVGERRLSRSGSTGDADGVGTPGAREELRDRSSRAGTTRLDEGDQSRDRGTITVEDSSDELVQ